MCAAAVHHSRRRSSQLAAVPAGVPRQILGRCEPDPRLPPAPAQADLTDPSSLPAALVGVSTIIDCATARPEESTDKVRRRQRGRRGGQMRQPTRHGSGAARRTLHHSIWGPTCRAGPVAAPAVAATQSIWWQR